MKTNRLASGSDCAMRGACFDEKELLPMKAIVFDAGPIISLTTNNLLFLLRDLKKRYKGRFYIPAAVRKELVDKPLETNRYKFEALQVMAMIEEGVLEIIHSEEIHKKAIKMLNLANSCFLAKGQPLKIIQFGEAEGMAAALSLNADAYVVDERTNRLLIENPDSLVHLWEHKLNTQIVVEKDNLKEFRKMTSSIRSLRSVELVACAYENHLLDRYLVKIKNPRHMLLEGMLWGLKMNGCAISRREIEQIVKIELKK